MKFALTLIQLCLLSTLFSQQIAWDKQCYLPKNDETVAITEDWEGNIVMIGTAEQRVARKTDILFWKVSHSGTTLARDYIGSTEAERANAVTATYDGGYAIAGSTSTKHQKQNRGKQALIVKVDKYGEVLWSSSLGGAKEDSFQDIVQLENGSLIAAGNKGKEVYVVSLAFNGELLWRQSLPKIEGIANTMIIDADGSIVLAGRSTVGLSERPFVAKLKPTGELVWKKTIQDRSMKIESVEDIILLDTGNYAITGLATQKGNGKNNYVLKINEKGRRISSYAFGAQGTDGANALIQNYEGDLLCTGFSNSHQRGARRYQLSFQEVSPRAMDIPLYSGNKQNDMGNDLLQASNGDYYITGYTKTSTLTKNNSYLLKINNPDTLLKTGYEGLEITELQFMDENKNDTLETSERGYLLLNICNNGQADVFGVTAKTRVGEYYVGGLNYTRSITIGYIPKGGCKKVGVPVLGTKKTRTGLSAFDIRIDSTNIQETAIINSKRIPAPELAITDSLFVIEERRKIGKRQEKITLKVRLKNIGEVAAENVVLKFSYPYKIEHLGEREFEIGTLLPGASVEQSFDFFAYSYYEKDAIPIKVVAWEDGIVRSSAIERFTIQLRPYDEFDLLENTQTETPKKQGRGPNDLSSYFMKDDITIDWISPCTYQSKSLLLCKREGKDLLSHRSVLFNPKFIIDVEGKPLEKVDFRLFIDGKDAIESDRLNSDSIIISEVSRSKKKHRYGILFKGLLLVKGKNKLQLKVKHAKSSVESITCEPEKVSLHVYSIGVPFDDLDYTTNDANDFGKLFQESTSLNSLFKDVHVNTYNTPERTTKERLEQTFNRIRHYASIEEPIKRGDLVLVFISSHGIASIAGQFYIVASDYDLNNIDKQINKLNFEQLRKEYLDVVEARKVIFLDACHSGLVSGDGAKSDSDFDVYLAKALENISKTSKDCTMFLSSKGTEKSYEADEWQNGAFTEALLEGFQKADQNNDSVIYTNELYEYVRTRVPELVKKAKRKQQTPYMPQAHLERDLPLYILKKE